MQSAKQKQVAYPIKDRDLERTRVITWFMDLANRVIPDVLQKNLLSDLQNHFDLGHPKEKLSNYGWALRTWLLADNEKAKELDTSEEQRRARAALKKLNSKESSALENIDKAHYERGETSPSEQTLDIFEKMFQGSKSIYTDGPEGLPIWLLMKGNQDTCTEFIEEVAEANGLRPEINSATVQWLFDELLDSQYRVDVENIPNLFQALAGSHPISLTFLERSKAYPFNDRTPEEEHLAWRRYDQALLMAIAVWRIVFQTNNTRHMRQMEWLMVGVCIGALGIRYNEAIQAYVLSKVQAYGHQIDAMLSDFGMKVVPFKERWKLLG
jgi:hypothetical protein